MTSSAKKKTKGQGFQAASNTTLQRHILPPLIGPQWLVLSPFETLIQN